jgi:hypothetical protein
MFFNLVKQFILSNNIFIGILSVSAVIFAVYFVWILKQKSKYQKYFRNITLILVAFYLLLIISIIIGQYYAFASSLRHWDYILHYTWFHGVGFYTIAIIVGGILFGLTALMNKANHYRLFYEEEYWLMALGGLITGFPNVIIFVSVLLFLTILAQIVAISKKNIERISMIYFWPIAILISYFLGGFISQFTGLYNWQL